MSVICRKVLLKLVLRTLTFLKRSHASTLSTWTEKIQAKTEEWATQTAIYCNTRWLQSFGTRNSSLANTKTFFLCEGNFQVQTPGAYIRRGDLTEGFLRYEFEGGLYLEGLQIFGILRLSFLGNEVSPGACFSKGPKILKSLTFSEQ